MGADLLRMVTLAATLLLAASGCNEELGLDEDGILYACNTNDDCGFGGFTCQQSLLLKRKVCRPPGYIEPDVPAADASADAGSDGGPSDSADDLQPNDVGPEVPLGVPCGPYDLLCPVGFSCDVSTGYCTGDGMRYVAAGTFWMGCDTSVNTACGAEEGPLHSVSVDHFLIHRQEVTVAQYGACVDEGECQPPPLPAGTDGTCNFSAAGRDEHPVNCLLPTQADTYCEWAGGRLCTEAEWELAARGSCDTVSGDCATSMRTYPWGEDAPTCALANYEGCADDTTPVGQRPDGASVYGVEDMSGNVREWVADGWHASYQVGDCPEDCAPDDGSAWRGDHVYQVKRGGGFLHPEADMRATTRSYDFTFEPVVGGVRCCADFSAGPQTCTTAQDCIDSLGLAPCIQRACNGGVCESQSLSGVDCDDGDPCTESDTCVVGVCQGSAYSCSSLQECRAASCDGQGGCEYTTNVGTCYIGNKCFDVGDPDPSGAACTSCEASSDSTWSPSPDGTPCVTSGGDDGLCDAASGQCVP